VVGPRVTEDEIILLHTKAEMENWGDIFDQIMRMPRRKRRFMLSWLRDGHLSITTYTLVEDDDPYEGMY
jgi:hypothetical protein